MLILPLYILTVSIFSGIESSRILAVFPTPSISHQVVFRPLIQELARRGHEVVVITPDPVFPKGQAPANLTEIDVHDISYTTWRQHFLSTSTGKSNDLFTQVKVIMELLTIIFEQQLMNNDIQKMINDKSLKFDLILLEACVRPSLIFSHIFKAPVIMISSFGAMYGLLEIMGAPSHPFLHPYPTRQKLYNLTVWEKITELYNHYYLESVFDNYEIIETQMLKKHFGIGMPSLRELSKNVDMLFLNVHPIWEANRSVPPSVIHIGGIHVKPEKELPQDLKSYLDSSENGVIYISFGTNVMPSMLPPERIQTLVNVFSQLPYDVLWKWDKDTLPGQTKNIRIEKWLPQSDLLRHPKVKLFITQGGLQSTDEAITAGVPLIGMPMLGDQWYNVEHYVHYRIGLRLDMETLTEVKFKNAFNTIIEDKSYRDNILKLRSLMNDQPQRPLDRAVWWTEHVLRHGGAQHLRSPAANMSWTEYLELEVVAVLLFGLLFTIVLISFIIYLLWNISQGFRTKMKLKKL